MNSTTPIEEQSTADETGVSASIKQTRKRRMAREPKAEPADAAGAIGTKPARKNGKPSEPRGPSKIAAVITLLERPEGATLAEMVEATGWLPHTTRAALTGLKKKGHEMTSVKADGVRTYRVIPMQHEEPSSTSATETPADA